MKLIHEWITTVYSKFNVLYDGDVLLAQKIKKNCINLIKTSNGPLFVKTGTSFVTMYKGRLTHNWAFVFFVEKKLEPGVTYMVKRGK